jgi:transcriptional regulator with XRE-family HTH domain
LFLVETDFVAWLQALMDSKDWNQSDLARASGMTPGQIARVMMGTRGVGRDFLEGVAKAFNIPLETVYRKAGWLPPDVGEVMPEAKAWSKRLMALPADVRTAAVVAIEASLHVAESGSLSRRG